ncbi:DNA repair protein RecN [Thermohalobacter berrensis]|uniref:DNA repair protein RecN n=1 Tax=Thermohalobacter berrensis TaxID=99594 RepID=A0A419TAR2_9FIRM|nr:DNA repair protein RecN [Thermohalobacter berrensis]
MLTELSIKNFAIIDNVHISFSKGFNVLTGETGAGKSILINAIEMVLGGRAAKEYVRRGKEKAIIEAIFQIENPNKINKILEEYGIKSEPDNTLLLTREIFSTGRSTSRINGRTVTLTMLNNLTKYLVDIHGQHEHQSLLTWENHINFIDLLGGNKVFKLKKNIKYYYNELKKYRNKLNSLTENEMERERQIDLLKFQIEEIDNAQLEENEEDELMNEYNILSNAEEIMKTIGDITEKLNSTDFYEKSLIDELNNILTNLQKISEHDSKLENYSNIVESIIFQLQDLSRELRLYIDTIEYDPERLELVNERIDLINKLKRKYGNSIKDILKYRDKIYKELQILENSKEEIQKINKEIKKNEDKLSKLCNELTKERRIIGNNIEKNITEELKKLNMKDIKFKVKYDKYDYFTENGLDKIEFYISPNPGEPLKPLSKIASGGEMSRIMLAFKSILAEVDEIPCLIFDEIDTGISGKTAQIVGRKISKLSKTRQIICITHLPQIASISESHFYIDKIVSNGRTMTKIQKLDYDGRIKEISRLLGGYNLTTSTKKYAEEMIKNLKNI